MGLFLKKSYSLQTLFITLSLVVLFLPILGIASLRVFENLLHRQTEAKLASEGAYIGALYLATLHDVGGGETLERPLVVEAPDPPPPVDDYWRPYFPQLDLWRDRVLPSAPDGRAPPAPPEPAALAAGAAIQPILKEAQRYTLSGARVLDCRGVVVASTGGQFGEDLSNRPEVKKALSGRYASVLRQRELWEAPRGALSRASRVRVYVAIPMLEGNRLAGVVYLHRTSLSFFLDLWETRYTAALAIVVALTLAIAVLLSYFVTRPLKSMIGQAQRIAAGESGVSLEADRLAPTEAHQLSEALSSMLEKLKSRYQYVEEFTRNVSHEFKTPLTSIQGSIEILKDNWEGMTPEERSRFLDMADAEARRMDRLVKRLIELTRLEIAAPVDAATDLAQLLPRLVRRYAEGGAEISLVMKEDSSAARIAPDMAETLLVNLIDNAVLHGRGAPVTVTLGGGPSVEVRDRGPGISPANLPRIFDRFFTTARERGGTGLGLGMVRAVARACEAEVEVEAGKEGTAFTVIFKPVRKAE